MSLSNVTVEQLQRTVDFMEQVLSLPVLNIIKDNDQLIQIQVVKNKPNRKPVKVIRSDWSCLTE